MPKLSSISAKYENIILAAVYTLAVIIFVAVRHDFHYGMNDDSLMMAITSGLYTGSPESRNIQIHYPLSAAISLFYRLSPAVPWHGLFLATCQFGSLAIIAYCSLRFCRKRAAKIALLSLQAAVVMATMLPHLVFIHYTVAGAMLQAAAVLCFLSHDVDGRNSMAGRNSRAGRNGMAGHGDGKYWPLTLVRANIPAIILLFVAFLLRFEMSLLLLPLIGVAGIWKMTHMSFSRRIFIQHLTLLGVILLSLGIGQAAHMLAYSSPPWQKFYAFFNNRVELYDYQRIPDYDAHVVFYDGIGLSAAEVSLLHGLNFGLSERIDEDILAAVAAYAKDLRDEERDFAGRVADKLRDYIRIMTDVGENSDFPHNSLIMAGYFALLGLGIFRNRLGRMLSLLLLLGGTRSALWLYLLLGTRYPPRITGPLYFMEMCILLALVLAEIREWGQDKRFSSETACLDENGKSGKPGTARTMIQKTYPPLVAVLTAFVALTAIPAAARTVARESAVRDEHGQTWLALQEYCRRHPQNFYFIDVYSWVDFTGKAFAVAEDRPANYDIMGGWAVKSPLQRKKLDYFLPPGMDMASAIAGLDHVYFVNGLGFDTAWLYAYYREQGMLISLEAVAVIDARLAVYSVTMVSLDGAP